MFTTIQIQKAIPKKHQVKVDEIEHYAGGFAIWLDPAWTWDRQDGNRSVEHYNYDDDYGQSIFSQIKEDFKGVQTNEEG